MQSVFIGSSSWTYLDYQKILSSLLGGNTESPILAAHLSLPSPKEGPDSALSYLFLVTHVFRVFLFSRWEIANFQINANLMNIILIRVR